MVREMGLFPFLFINAFLLAMAGVIIVAAVQGRRRAALVKATPTTNIGMATDGYREFEGTIAYREEMATAIGKIRKLLAES